jgi:hypothetical protein
MRGDAPFLLMPNLYPKMPADIGVCVTTTKQDPVTALTSTDKYETTLLQLLDGWLMRMGYSSVHVKGVVSQLLTSGKVQVVFRNNTDRFELLQYGDVISASQAMSLLEDYVASQKQVTGEDGPAQSATTQRIVVQIPGRR